MNNESESSAQCADGRREERRQRIVDVARTHFLQHGYAGTSMSGLLKPLGGSKTTIWAYFPTKQELFAAVIEDLTASFKAELEDALSLTGSLELGLAQFCRTMILKLGMSEMVATWRLVVAESGRFPEVGRTFYDRAAKHTHTALANYLRRYVDNGELTANDTSEMANTLISFCASQQNKILWSIEPERTVYSDVEADVGRTVNAFFAMYRVK
ncbi:TetR/AcrR family transcriptional regulator [Sphingomonas sp. GB1N7]|uniref:TetR/AcrR family transcriptional regulator n=1 Tax=Parasphingomonas caseinilytica TaxID=3096158 RepID=UPI002FC7D5F1